MHVCRLYIARACDLVHTYIYGLVRAGRGGGGRVYEIKALRSNLAPEEGESIYSGG